MAVQAAAVIQGAKTAIEILQEVQKLKDFYPSTYSQHDKEGGIWIEGVSDGKVFSFYYHATKWHKASVFGKVKVYGDWVGPGQIAVAIATQQWLGGNKAFYNTKPDQK